MALVSKIESIWKKSLCCLMSAGICLSAAAYALPARAYAAPAVKEYVYDAAGKLIESSLSGGGTTRYGYDANGNTLGSANFPNLLLNGDFEAFNSGTGVADKWNSFLNAEGGFQIVSSSVSSGKHAQRLTGTTMPAGSQVTLYQQVQVEAERPYAVKGRFLTEQLSNASVKLIVDFYDSKMGYLGAVPTPYGVISGQYVTLSAVGTVPKQASFARVYAMLLSTGANGSGAVIVDSMSLQYDDGNLLTHSDFEKFPTPSSPNSVDDWGSYKDGDVNGSVVVIGTPVSSGARAVQLTGASMPKDHQVNIFQDVKVEPGRQFSAKGRFLTESLIQTRADLYVDFKDASNRYLGTISAPYNGVTGMYVTLAAAGVVPPQTAYARVYAVLRATGDNGGGTVRVDSLRFSYDDSNLLSNPGFEQQYRMNGAPGDWYSYKDVPGNVSTITSPVSEGRKAVRIIGEQMLKNRQINIFQDIKVEPGQNFTAKGDFLVESLANAQADLYVDFLNGSSQYVGTFSKTVSTASGQYASLSVSGTAPAQAAAARVYAVLRSTADNGSGSIVVDSLSFIK